MSRLLRSPLWIALLIALADVISGFGIGEPFTQAYWNTVYKVWQRPVPRSYLIVNTGNNGGLDAVTASRLLDCINSGNPARVYIDTSLNLGQDQSAKNAVKRSLNKFGSKVVFVKRMANDFSSKIEKSDLNFPIIMNNYRVVASAWSINFAGFAESSPYKIQIGGREIETFAADLGGAHSGRQSLLYPDFSLDPATIQTVAASALLERNDATPQLTGRTVVISDPNPGEMISYFGHGVIHPVALDIAGAEALHRPFAFNLSELAMVAVVFALLYAGHHRARGKTKRIVYLAVPFVLVLLPILLRAIGLLADPTAAMLCAAIFAAIRIWQKRIRRAQLTSVSGLPNIHALSSGDLPNGRDVVVVSIARFDEIMATLPRHLHSEYAHQIARRITVGCGARDIFQSDGGHFAWVEEARPLDMQLSHLEGLRALFSSPLHIGSYVFDSNVHFGLDRNEGVETGVRVNSAMASSNEARNHGRGIELFEAHRLAQAAWELALHANIDDGLRNGDIWLAYQAQWDIATNRICGAEALIRWNHPVRGPIAPHAFILQAERAGRIDALTYWVLDEAVGATLALNAHGDHFQMSINLSGQMVDKPELVNSFTEIVARHGANPRLITIEVTETTTMGNRAIAVNNLTQLRQMGFRLSIDDFGTGEASLAYLADLPSDELKIDRCFVSRIIDSDRERAIVASTIQLAHTLGQTVVAEGIEDAATLAMLRDMGCDLAQGFHLGRPQPLTSFEREYATKRKSQFGLV